MSGNSGTQRIGNRADVVFLINGIPVAVVETKNAGKPDGLALGVEQIRRYHDETPEMFTTAQLFGVTQMLDFLYGVTWNVTRKNLFNWKNRRFHQLRTKSQNFLQSRSFLEGAAAVHYLPEQRRPTHQDCVASTPDACGGEGD